MKVSVITVNLNNEAGLLRTMNSVLNQSYDNYEYIIIDGGSADGSREIIQEYSERLTYHISEPDKGAYDAMNKGIANSSGDYLIFLNSGDLFMDPNSLKNLIVNSNEKDIVYGELLVKSDFKEWKKSYPIVLTKDYFKIESLPHPAMLIKRKLFNTVGNYDLKFKICSDWAFYLKAIFNFKCTYQYVPLVISVFYIGGMSSSGKNKEIILSERKAIWNEVFPWDKYILHVKKLFK